ncbi:hypothetical protein DRN46_03015 [Thermococci archaeon]|nr:MAG: hypothetical protein DRN46_03015 [Thermococci archaeon]
MRRVMIRAHVIEDNIVSKIAEALEDLDADLTEIEIEVPSLKYSIERQMFSTMKFNLVGKEVEEAFNRIEKIVRDADGRIINIYE